MRIYTWEEYLSEDVIELFEEQTGHSITQIYFENEQLRDEVITTDRALAYDLFIMDGYTLNAYSAAGMAKNLSSVSIPNLKHINQIASSVCGDWGVPYSWGTMGIGYRESLITQPVTSWSQVFSLSKKGTNIVIPSDDLDTVGFALLSLGLNPMTNDENELRQAYKLLANSKKDILAFRSAVGYSLEMMATSSMEMAVMYSGETYTIREATGQDDWHYVVPQEGTLMWYECFAVPSEKPLSDATIAFLNFINEPKIAAMNAEDLWIATANESALNFVSDEYLNDRELFPETEVLDRSFQYTRLDQVSSKTRARMISALNNK